MSNPKVVERIERLLELPAAIDVVGRRKVAMRAERRKLERRLKAREATVRKDLLDLELYKGCGNADERAAVYQDALHTDPSWEEMQERLEQLTVAIEKAQHEQDVLDHERKALKAVLEREYAEILREALEDKALAGVVMGRRTTA
jgi:predicted lipid-binding transport protein (Tim44 family)